MLEVSELGDLLPIQPDLPAQTPGPKGWPFPIVLHKTDVVLVRVNAHGFQGAQVDLLGVSWVRLEDDLELVVQLHAIGIFAIATVIGSHRGFYIAYIPGLRSKHAQSGSRIHRTGPHLSIVGLPDQTALLIPEVLQGHEDGLKV